VEIRKKNITLKIKNIAASCPDRFWNLSFAIFKIKLNTALIRPQSEFKADPLLSTNLDLTNSLPV